MDNPVFGSSQFASTMKKLNFETRPQVRGRCTYIGSGAKHMIPRVLRQGRQYEAKCFRIEYLCGSSLDRKTCIWSCGGDSWLEKSSGIMWVGVHGTNSICVVTRTGDLDIKRVRGSLKDHTIEAFLHHFRKTVIAEIEDLADPPYKLRPGFPDPFKEFRQRVHKSYKKPFGIVSVGTDEVYKEFGHEASNDEYERGRDFAQSLEKRWPYVSPAPAQCDEKTPAQRDEKNTIKYLQEKMESDPTFTINETVQAFEYDEKKAIKSLREKMESDVAFTMDETIQAAISAFQHLFGKKFKANEIGVTVMDPNYVVSKHEAKYNDVYAKELEINDIEKHLAVVNEPGRGGSSGSRHSHSTVISLELEDDMDE